METVQVLTVANGAWENVRWILLSSHCLESMVISSW